MADDPLAGSVESRWSLETLILSWCFAAEIRVKLAQIP